MLKKINFGLLMKKNRQLGVRGVGFGTNQGKGVDNFSMTEECRIAIEKNLIPKGKLLRLGVMGGEGCGGFSYKFEVQENSLVEDSDQ